MTVRNAPKYPGFNKRPVRVNKLVNTNKKASTFCHEGQFKIAETIGRKLNPDIKGVVSIRGREGYLFVGETKVKLQRKSACEEFSVSVFKSTHSIIETNVVTF